MHNYREMVVFIFPVQAENIFEGVKNPFQLSNADSWNGFCFVHCQPDNNELIAKYFLSLS
jgi:hypothetical protein